MPRKLFRYIIVFILILVASFSFGYLKTFFSMNKTTKDNQNIQQQKDVVQVKDTKDTLQIGARFFYTTHYTQCGHEHTEEKIIEDIFLGLTEEELTKNIKDWSIVYFSPMQVNLKRNIHSLCDEHYYIGIYQGYVALFKGQPGLESTLVEKTDILSDVLREDDRRLLEQGLIINDKQEFLKIREGLTN